MAQQENYQDVLERWYQCEIPREELRELMQRNDYRGLIHFGGYLSMLIGLGVWAYYSIGTWLMIPAFFVYGTVYCFTNHLMHETHHRTPFKTQWLNETIHWIAAFFNGAEAVRERWGHTHHHTYTYFYDTDPEIETGRPASIPRMIAKCFGYGLFNPTSVIQHAFGYISPKVREYVPESEFEKMKWSSRFWLLGIGLIIASCFVFQTPLPLVFTVFARFYGAFIPKLLDLIQHIGLDANVYDHRLCTRDVYINPLLQFLYWNMNFHIEHHMFPAVPFHALPKLHARIKDQLPRTYTSLFDAYREMIPTVLRQQRETGYFYRPELPDPPKVQEAPHPCSRPSLEIAAEGWVPVMPSDQLEVNDVLPFTHEEQLYAIYRLQDGFYATANKCTHAGALLSRGLVVDDMIECPAHQGRFDIRTGKATCSPACVNVETFSIKEENGHLYIQLPVTSTVKVDLKDAQQPKGCDSPACPTRGH